MSKRFRIRQDFAHVGVYYKIEELWFGLIWVKITHGLLTYGEAQDILKMYLEEENDNQNDK